MLCLDRKFRKGRRKTINGLVGQLCFTFKAALFILIPSKTRPFNLRKQHLILILLCTSQSNRQRQKRVCVAQHYSSRAIIQNLKSFNLYYSCSIASVDFGLNISTMDTISALDVAGGILAIVEFTAELICPSNQPVDKSSLDDREAASVLETGLGTLRLALSSLRVSAEQQFSAGLSPPSSHALALQELASSCIEDTGKLLEDVRKMPPDFQARERSQLEIDTAGRFRSMLRGRLGEEKIERLSRAVTLHVSSIIRCAI